MEVLSLLEGGAILKDPSITRCQAIVNMIRDPSSEVTLLTYSSLKGFIFTLNVRDTTKILFRNMKYIREPDIQKYIIKVVLITKDGDDDLPALKAVDKQTESMISFYREAKLQSRIWELSTLSKKPNFSPSVVDFSLFNQKKATEFINLLKSKILPGSIGMEVIDYLLPLVANKTYTLGTLIMPCLMNSLQMSEYRPAMTNLTDLYINSLAKVISLYLFNGLIHYDLHPGNILVKRNDDGSLSPFVIDFGRASQVDLLDPNEYFKGDEYISSPADQKDAFDHRKRFFDRFLELCCGSRRGSPVQLMQDRIQLITEIIAYLSRMDHTTNHRLFVMPDPAAYQLSWHTHVTTGAQREQNLSNIWAILESDNVMEDVGTGLSTIQELKKTNKLINFIEQRPEAFFSSPDIIPGQGSAASTGSSGAAAAPWPLYSPLSIGRSTLARSLYNVTNIGNKKKSLKKYRKSLSGGSKRKSIKQYKKISQRK